jgi:hypothetical protein
MLYSFGSPWRGPLQAYVSAASHSMQQGTHYRDAHPALFRGIKPHISHLAHNTEEVTNALTQPQNMGLRVSCRFAVPLCSSR